MTRTSSRAGSSAAPGCVPAPSGSGSTIKRHTHAALLLENGETERYVAERLGDTVEMIHEVYGHVPPKMRDPGRPAPRRGDCGSGRRLDGSERSVSEPDSGAVEEGTAE